jgi:hypothetical protein
MQWDEDYDSESTTGHRHKEEQGFQKQNAGAIPGSDD